MNCMIGTTYSGKLERNRVDNRLDWYESKVLLNCLDLDLESNDHPECCEAFAFDIIISLKTLTKRH